jgi:GNAT superfamily N-acetyltransferase
MLLLVSELDPNGPIRGPEIKGVVMLWMPYSETGSFRGFVENLLVHKSHRGKGGARALMSALETEALNRGRTLLVCCISFLCIYFCRFFPKGERNISGIILTYLASCLTLRAATKQKLSSRGLVILSLERSQDMA